MNYKKDDFIYYQIVYPKIIETLRLVAAPSKIQLSTMSASICPPDEISEILEHACMMAKVLLKKNSITQEQYSSIEVIDNNFKNFPKGDWTIKAMKQSDNWDTVRELANKSLKEFSTSYAIPNIYWYKTI